MPDNNPDDLDDVLDLAVQGAPGFVMIPSFGSTTTPPAKLSRHTVTADAILSAEEVVQLLGGRSSATRRWLRSVPPLRHPSGRRVYLWGDVIAVLKEAA